MSSPWKNKQPEEVADAVLKRAELGKVGRKLKARLALAQLKVARGWEDLTLDTIEPRVEEELRRRRPMSSGDILSDSSSSTSGSSDFRHHNTRQLMSSPLKEAPTFSDRTGSRSGSGSGSDYRKRNYHRSFDLPTSNTGARKRIRSSPAAGRSIPGSRSCWKDNQLSQSSPIKPRKHTHFTTSSGPGLSFYPGMSQVADDLSTADFAAASDDDENSLPAHSFNINSSPPRTPPARNRSSLGRRNKDRNGKSEEGADLLLYLATSPSPANPTSRARMHPPSTPPPKNLGLPSSMATTPGGSGNFLSVFPNTPSQAFDFSDFVNITPSPAQNAWPKTPRTAKTPLTVARRRLTFENFSPNLRDPAGNGTKGTGLGMQLGGELLP